MRVTLTDQDLYEIRKGTCVNVIVDDGQEMQLGPLDFTGRQENTLRAGGDVTIHRGDLDVTVAAATTHPAKRYLITVEGGIHPKVHGCYGSQEERVAEARRLHAAQDPDTDAVFVADVTPDGGLRVDSFSAAFFEHEEPTR